MDGPTTPPSSLAFMGSPTKPQWGVCSPPPLCRGKHPRNSTTFLWLFCFFFGPSCPPPFDPFEGCFFYCVFLGTSIFISPFQFMSDQNFHSCVESFLFLRVFLFTCFCPPFLPPLFCSTPPSSFTSPIALCGHFPLSGG